MNARHLKPLGVVALILAVGLGANGGTGHAQDQPEHTLVIFACDPAHPVLFQPLAPDSAPDPAAFAPYLELPLTLGRTTPVLYVAVKNTGWSEGAIGLIGSGLALDETYVALEVRSNGAGGYRLRQDGRGLAFPLHYVADLDGKGSPGFQLDLLVGQMTSLRLYRAVETGGVSLRATTYVRGSQMVTPQRATYVVNPDAALGGLVFEVHIAALPTLQPTAVPTPTPTLESAAAPALASPTPTPESGG
jgi:hypothetical protein